MQVRSPAGGQAGAGSLLLFLHGLHRLFRDLGAALDGIIAIQEELIGGDGA